MKILLLFLLTSCASVVQPLNTSTVHKKDVKFYVNEKKISGVGVVPKESAYEIYIKKDEGKIDLLTLSSCHRVVQVEDEGSKATYNFKPTQIEIESGCPIDIGIYDKKGRHGWGLLLFENEKATLPAEVLCNGEKILSKGTSICQSQVGTIQKIKFSVPVRSATTEGCYLEPRGQEFEYEMGKEFCYMAFMDDNGNIHNHTSFGYETFIIRE